MSTDLALLRRAADYALCAFDTVTPQLLSRPTPCHGWNLHMLLSHTGESVGALGEGLDDGRVGLFPTHTDLRDADPARVLSVRVKALRDTWIAASDERVVAVADHRLPLSTVVRTAALEIAVHGWDVYQASGHDRPIPIDLAADLLAISSQLVPDEVRHQLFASPIVTADTAGPGERLLAFLGRPSPA
jgi:uncharacterized protein (TIGR03086 family)